MIKLRLTNRIKFNHLWQLKIVKFNCNKCDKPYGKMAHLNHHHQVVHKDFHMLAKNVASYLHRDTTLICILDMYIMAWNCLVTWVSNLFQKRNILSIISICIIHFRKDKRTNDTWTLNEQLCHWQWRMY